MNAGVGSEKEKVKESQSRRVTPPLDIPSGAGSGASQSGYVRGLWEDMFLRCERSTRKSLASHLLRDDNRLEEDVSG